jgi:S1-C subfamily serine protease
LPAQRDATVLATQRRSQSSADPATRVGGQVVSIRTTRARTISEGTGMVLTPSGRVLTNSHVVQDALSLEATVGGTGATYRALVIGTDPQHDVAVLQLVGAGGLATVSLGDSRGVALGHAVQAVGNAAHGGGSLLAASGLVVELGRSLVAGNPGHANEELTDLIVFAASIESGDSGGPLIDTAGDVIGLVTAGEPTAAGMVGYAIPINTAIAIANQLTR